jgi:hypothetical protein
VISLNIPKKYYDYSGYNTLNKETFYKITIGIHRISYNNRGQDLSVVAGYRQNM